MVENEYIEFREVVRGGEGARKTSVWSVVSKSSGDSLGRILWFGRWRQYCFFPEEETVWNVGCLASVQEFISEQMAARRNG